MAEITKEEAIRWLSDHFRPEDNSCKQDEVINFVIGYLKREEPTYEEIKKYIHSRNMTLITKELVLYYMESISKLQAENARLKINLLGRRLEDGDE